MPALRSIRRSPDHSRAATRLAARMCRAEEAQPLRRLHRFPPRCRRLEVSLWQVPGLRRNRLNAGLCPLRSTRARGPLRRGRPRHLSRPPAAERALKPPPTFQLRVGLHRTQQVPAVLARRQKSLPWEARGPQINNRPLPRREKAHSLVPWTSIGLYGVGSHCSRQMPLRTPRHQGFQSTTRSNL
jgi:hypothetical protein